MLQKANVGELRNFYATAIQRQAGEQLANVLLKYYYEMVHKHRWRAAIVLAAMEKITATNSKQQQ